MGKFIRLWITMFKLLGATIAVVFAMLVLIILSFLFIENRNISNGIDLAYLYSDQGLHGQGMTTLQRINRKWMVANLGMHKRNIQDSLVDIGIRKEHQDILRNATLEMDNGNEALSISQLQTLSEDSFYYQEAQTNIQKGLKLLIEKDLSKENSLRMFLNDQLKIAEKKISVERSAKKQEEMVRKQAEEEANYQRLRKEEQSTARISAEAEVESQKLAREEQVAARKKAEEMSDTSAYLMLFQLNEEQEKEKRARIKQLQERMFWIKLRVICF